MCLHEPVCTGRRIEADYGKPNLPDGERPVVSTGWYARCCKCGQPLIMHDERYGFAERFTELENDKCR